jgi:hypothetical protein
MHQAALNEAGRAPPWRALTDLIIERRPDVAKAFGAAVIEAAARPMSAGTCRFCYAVAVAQAKQLPLPSWDAAIRYLLGQSCSMCLPNLRAALHVRQHYARLQHGRGGLPTTRARPASSRTAVAQLSNHSPDGCAVCALSQAARHSLTASGQPDRELAEVAGRAGRPHAVQRLGAGKPVRIERDRGGVLRVRYNMRGV